MSWRFETRPVGNDPGAIRNAHFADGRFDGLSHGLRAHAPRDVCGIRKKKKKNNTITVKKKFLLYDLVVFGEKNLA